MVLLSVCMIVKDEARDLPRCLSSLKALEDTELVVVDTGSTDGTVAIAESFGAQVLHHAWSGDFAEARNVGLTAATGEFVLIVDADEELLETEAPSIMAALRADLHDVWHMPIHSKMPGDKLQVHRYPRLFRRWPDARFCFAIHEQIWPSLEPHSPRVDAPSFRIVHHGYDLLPDALREKQRRNLEAALLVLKREPNQPMYLFHVGLAYVGLGEAENAVKWLERALRFTAAGPDRAPVLNALAQSHYDEDHHRAAELRLRESVAVCKQQHHAWALLADLLLLQQRHTEAVEVLQNTLAVKTSALHTDFAPDGAVLLMKLGMAQLVTHSPVPAVENLSAALELGLSPKQAATAERYLGIARRGLEQGAT